MLCFYTKGNKRYYEIWNTDKYSIVREYINGKPHEIKLRKRYELFQLMKDIQGGRII